MTYHVEFDGLQDGPTFGRDEQDAHDWAAANHPGEPYSIVVLIDGEGTRWGSVRYEAGGRELHV